MELVKCVRADPEAVTKHALQRHVFAALLNEGEVVSLQTVDAAIPLLVTQLQFGHVVLGSLRMFQPRVPALHSLWAGSV